MSFIQARVFWLLTMSSPAALAVAVTLVSITSGGG